MTKQPWQRYLSALFEPTEYVCAGNSKYDIGIQEMLNVSSPACFIAINSLAHKTSRKDENVATFRNMLLEFDKGSIEEQYRLIKRLRIPYTTLTFSGSKSLHAIISLTEPLGDKKEFDEAVGMLHIIAPEADPKAKNCSRFTRMAGAIRPESGVLQELIEVRPRLSKNDFVKWLLSHSGKVAASLEAARIKQLKRMRDVEDREPGELSTSTMRFLENAVVNAGTSRHDRLMSLALECRDCSWAYESTLDIVEQMAVRLGKDLVEVEKMVNYAYSGKRR